MSKITLNIDILAGTDIKDAVIEARSLARRLDLSYVCFKVNGTGFSVGQTADLDTAMDKYHNNDKHIIQP